MCHQMNSRREGIVENSLDTGSTAGMHFPEAVCSEASFLAAKGGEQKAHNQTKKRLECV